MSHLTAAIPSLAASALLGACKSRTTSGPKVEVCPLASGSTAPVAAPRTPALQILVFSRTLGFRHACIPAAITAVEVLGALHRFAFAAVVFLLTTGDGATFASHRAIQQATGADHLLGGIDWAAGVR